MKARLHEGAGGTYLWIVNPIREARTVRISLPSPYHRATELWRESGRPMVADGILTTTVGDRDAAVIRLE